MNKFQKLSFALALFMILSQNSFAAFSDVASDSPYYKAINYLQENNIVQGYEDGFHPDQKLNRAEAIKIILLGSKILVPDIQDQTISTDVVTGTWYAKFFAKAKNLGIMSGDGGTGLLRPGDTINLAEILKILLKTNHIEVTEPSSPPYADVPVDSWFAPYFGYASSISLLPKSADNNAHPDMQVTRAMMAQLIYGLAVKPEGYQEGKATYYGANFTGKGTASGEVFDNALFTAAHPTLPFGTLLKVVNLDNGKETEVKVNDRGPYGDSSRIIDLSIAAFEAIAPLSQGVTHVSITPVNRSVPEPVAPTETETQTVSCPPAPASELFDKNTFENITLDTSLPNIFLADEVLSIKGHSASDLPQVSAFLSDASGNQTPFTTQTEADGSFSLRLFFSKPGTYKFGILPGLSGSTVIKNITVLPRSCTTESEDDSLPTLSNPEMKVMDGETVINWNNDSHYEAIKMTFTQGNKQKAYLFSGSEFSPHYADFVGWSAGDVGLKIQGAHPEQALLSANKKMLWSKEVSLKFKAETHHEYIVEKEKVDILSPFPNTLKSGTPLSFKVDPKVNLDTTGKIILPNGQVEEIVLESPTHTPMIGPLGNNILPSSATEVTLNFTPKSDLIHFFEINDEQGIAAVNIPVYPSNVYPLIPNPIELSSLKPEPLSQDLVKLQTDMLALINADRAAADLTSVKLDKNMSQLAQARSDDMVKRAYFGHQNPDDLNANDLRKNFAIIQFVSENIARDVNSALAEYGLMRSASHRSNILNKEWKRVGLGFSSNGDKGTIFVQLFSADPIDFSKVDDLKNDLVTTLNSKRSTTIALDKDLNTSVQSWADDWGSAPWCDIKEATCNPLTKSATTTFIDFLRNAGINESLGAYYRGDSSFENIKKSIVNNSTLKESRWTKIGLGLKQDSFGIIHLFLAYTE